MKSLKDIKKLLKEHQAELKEKYNVKELGVLEGKSVDSHFYRSTSTLIHKILRIHEL
jgi:hypothetical protein